MTITTKNSLIARLTARFPNTTARAAAINEVLAAAEYSSCYDALTKNAINPVEAIYAWAVRRGQVWA